MATQKPYRMCVRVKDGKPREPNKLKGLLVPHVDVTDAKAKIEFFIDAVKETHLEQVRARLDAAGLEEIPVPERPDPFRKPYGFVSLSNDMTTAAPVWHDGTSSEGRLSGEIRFELETLTPLLVGWERQTLTGSEEPWTIPTRKVPRSTCAAAVQAAARDTYPDATDEQKRKRKRQKIEDDRRQYVERVQDHIVDVQVQKAGWSIDSKSLLCPLRAPWGKRPVIIPGDSLKGLLRHELGALLGAPMERVAERSYSYRPNALFTKDAEPKLIARIACVPDGGIEMRALDDTTRVRVPTKLDLLPTNLRYDKKQANGHWAQASNYYCFDAGNGSPYRGGQGAGKKLNSKRKLHKKLTANPNQPTETATLSQSVQEGYLATVRHLVDEASEHFSERHPDAREHGANARTRILDAAKDDVFQPGDLIWVEWDTQKKCIVSLGWHYYYRWAYTDSVRKTGGMLGRHGLFPLDAERALDGADADEHRAPTRLSVVRRLFGYTGDNDGSAGIGKGDYTQLMGRLFPNSAVEVVGENESNDDRFLKPIFLRELGMPRPSAVEHYLKQPHHPGSRPSDNATLATYGDAAGYDAPGELAGRKFYLDRPAAVAEDAAEANRFNDRSPLALEASKPGRKFRFTVRFRNLDPAELTAVLVALCPDQFKAVLGGTHADGYCSKLGYARPLGWGSVHIEARQILFLDEAGDAPALTPEDDLAAWVTNHHQETAMQAEWLAIHRRNHPDAADYPRKDGEIYSFHTWLRARHARARRYRNERKR